MKYERDGVVRVHDTWVSVWEDRQADICDEAMLWVFQSVIARLVARGWKFREDPRITYAPFRPYHRLGVKGDLRMAAESSGRTAKFKIYQEVSVENRNGGRYDFQKFARMPRRDMRTACVVEMTAIARKLVELGYSLDQRAFSGDAGPGLLREMLRAADGSAAHFADEPALAHFNRGWTHDRFARDETGWPAASEYTCWPYLDRDGAPLHQGAVRYARLRGRLVRGRVYNGINGMWWLVDATDRVVACALGAREFFSNPDEPRRFVPKQIERLHAELEKATKAKNYGRAAVLGGVLARMTKPAEAAAQ